MTRREQDNKLFNEILEAIPDLMEVIKEYKKTQTVKECGKENWQRLADVRYKIDGNGTNLSCGTCKAAMMLTIVCFLDRMRYFY